MGEEAAITTDANASHEGWPANTRETRLLPRYSKQRSRACGSGHAICPMPEDREWIRGCIAVPLQEATDAALEVLTWAVARSRQQAPDGLLERLERSRHLVDMGIE